MKTILKWTWRIVRFPFVLVIGVVAGAFVGGVVSFDWLINPIKWDGFTRKGV